MCRALRSQEPQPAPCRVHGRRSDGRALHRRFGSRTVLVADLSVQGLATLPLVFLGADRMALAVVVPALFIGFFGHVTCTVAYTVTATSGLPNEDQGLATGLTSTTQQVAVTAGIPILSAIAATQSAELTGLHLALSVNLAMTLVSVVLIRFGLRPRGKAGAVVAAVAVANEAEPGRPVR
jgi:predicted MFS family arabinose efflux permease